MLAGGSFLARRIALAGLGCAFLTIAGPARAQERCGIYPDIVYEQALYRAFSACDLKKLGEPVLWQGLPADTRQVTRFVFTEGHGAFLRVVRITEFADGTAEMRVRGMGRTGENFRETRERGRRIRLSADTIARIEALAAQADAWKYEVGTWDNQENGEPHLFLHCQLLEMERANGEGYRYSSVNISCNRPAKLMPLVDEVARLAGIEFHDGLFH